MEANLKIACASWALLFACLTGCRTVDVTGRHQLLLVPENQEVAMGATAFQEILRDEPPSQNQHYVELVQRVGQRIAAVANRPDFAWEFKVIASPEQNAFCLPGGKVAVYEGIIPVCQNEAGLAVVMSHEIAHALARHGGERMSQGYMVDGAKLALSTIMQNKEQVIRDRVMGAYGVASKYGFTLPYSRKHESEADHMGLILMAQAGYDPTEAPAFWRRFRGVAAGQNPPELLSTHPSDDRRAQDLSALLPAAIRQYGSAPVQFAKGQPIHPSPSNLVQTPTRPDTPIAQTSFAPSGRETPAPHRSPLRDARRYPRGGILNPLR